MKHMLASVIVVATLVIAAPSTPSAQQPGQPHFVQITGPAVYTIVDGDRVWNLNPHAVPQIQAANPFLNNRRFTAPNGGLGLTIYPDEQLQIPAGVTITFRRTTPLATTPPNPTPAPVAIVAATPEVTAGEFKAAMDALQSNFLWGLLGIVAVVLALAGLMWWLFRRLNQANDNQRLLDNAAQDRRLANLSNLINERHTNLLNQLDERRRADNLDADVRNLLRLNALQNLTDLVEGLYHLNLLQEVTPIVVRAYEFGAGNQQAERLENVGDGQDFVEVHKANGERISLMVRHNTAVTPNADGVGVNGIANVLTLGAAEERRERAEEVRQTARDADLAAQVTGA